MPSQSGSRSPHDAEDLLAAIDWYRRCLEDLQDGRTVTGLREAKLGFDAAMDHLRTLTADRTACGLCGGYGAASTAGEPRPCIGCGKKAVFAVVMPLDMLRPDEPSFAGPQRHGLRVIEGGQDG